MIDDYYFNHKDPQAARNKPVTQQLTYTDAIRLLADLRGTVEGEHWVTGPMQRAVIVGIRMSIKALEKAASETAES